MSCWQLQATAWVADLAPTAPPPTHRARERANRPQTRRRRENTDECHEKLRHVRENIHEACAIMAQVCRRERRKRDIMVGGPLH
jgi:enhancer of polycomb-like protein